ncbi:MAG: glycosyltransferase family 2 protein [Undibacterium sp.]|nr:glycosyltransferase family 2 protein [Opitutaceae bacterium]
MVPPSPVPPPSVSLLSTLSSQLPLSQLPLPAPPALTVIIPFYNEAPNIPPLLAELRAALDPLDLTVEILLINDGSTDATDAALASAAAEWPAIRLENFPRNRGQAAALWWGFQNARGTWLAMLDGDGQNPPDELARLWPLRHTADMLAGARLGRRDSPLRRAMSRLANATRRTLLRDGVSDTGCSLKLFRREVAASFLPIRTLYSFLPAFAVAAGWTVREVPVAHRARRAGVSKYGLRAMAVLPLLDLLTLTWLLRRHLRR